MSTAAATGHLTAPPPVAAARFRLGVAGLVVALGCLVVLGLLVGSNPLGPGEVWSGLTGRWPGGATPDPVLDRVVWTLRVPRTLLAVLVGAGLGVAGAVMQSLTRNPLADPGILGVNAGAALAVAVGLAAGIAGSVLGTVWWSLAGALVASVAVYALGSVGGGTTPVRLALAGTAVSACLVSVTTGLALTHPRVLDIFRFWSVGSFEGRRWAELVTVTPFLAVGIGLAFASARALDALAMGEDSARSLGVPVWLTRAAAVLATALTCGAAVAAAGPIGFVGLTVPHVVRSFTGPVAQRVLPGCALAGAVLVLGADVVGRLVARPGELEAGIVTALVGGPVFVALVRRRGAVAL